MPGDVGADISLAQVKLNLLAQHQTGHMELPGVIPQMKMVMHVLAWMCAQKYCLSEEYNINDITNKQEEKVISGNYKGLTALAKHSKRRYQASHGAHTQINLLDV